MNNTFGNRGQSSSQMEQNQMQSGFDQQAKVNSFAPNNNLQATPLNQAMQVASSQALPRLQQVQAAQQAQTPQYQAPQYQAPQTQQSPQTMDISHMPSTASTTTQQPQYQAPTEQEQMQQGWEQVIPPTPFMQSVTQPTLPYNANQNAQPTLPYNANPNAQQVRRTQAIDSHMAQLPPALRQQFGQQISQHIEPIKQEINKQADQLQRNGYSRQQVLHQLNPLIQRMRDAAHTHAEQLMAQK